MNASVVVVVALQSQPSMWVEHTVVIVGLSAALVAEWWLGRRYGDWFPTSPLIVACGALMGAVGRPSTKFNPDLFFAVILPPILFWTGYSMPLERFKGHRVGVAAHAFVGTLVTVVLVTVSLWYGAPLVGAYRLGWYETMILASIVGATDPVSVVPMVSSPTTPPSLYALIVGESSLNDVVGVAMFHHLTTAYMDGERYLTWLAVASTFGGFVWSGVVAAFLGCCVGWGCCLLTSKLGDHPTLYTLMATLPWASYTACEAAHVSGIVGILVCGMVVAQRCDDQRIRSGFRHQYHTLAHLADTFVLCTMGVSLGTTAQFGSNAVLFAGLASVSVILARAVQVLCVGCATNLCRRQRYSWIELVILWLAGMRGSIAFALVLTVGRTIANEHATDVMVLSTIGVTLSTTLLATVGVPMGLRCLSQRRFDPLPTEADSRMELDDGQVEAI